jgi:hypothetical protein
MTNSIQFGDMGHITTWEEDYKGNNTSPSLQSPLASSSTPSCMSCPCVRLCLCLVCFLVGWSVSQVGGWLVGQLLGQSGGWLAGCLVGWLVGQLVGRLCDLLNALMMEAVSTSKVLFSFL